MHSRSSTLCLFEEATHATELVKNVVKLMRTNFEFLARPK